MMLNIWIGVVMALYCLALAVPWYCCDWCSRVFGFDGFTLTQGGSHDMLAIVPIVLLLDFVPAVLLRRWVRREKKAVAQGKRPCLHCGYDLRGHESAGTCPECGTSFELAEIKWYFRELSDLGRCRHRMRGVAMHGARCMTPMISRRRRQLTIFACVVMAFYVLFYLGASLCPDWTKHVLGVDIFTLTDPDSMLRYWVPVVTVVLVLAAELLFRLWVRREKKAFKQGKLPCLECLYDVSGATSNRCWECGTPFTKAEIEDYFQHLANTGRRRPEMRLV